HVAVHRLSLPAGRSPVRCPVVQVSPAHPDQGMRLPRRGARGRAPAFKTGRPVTCHDGPMRFDTKIAVVVRSDLATWQKLNVTAFLASGVAAGVDEVAGKPYEDGSGNRYLEMFPARAGLPGHARGRAPAQRAAPPPGPAHRNLHR